MSKRPNIVWLRVFRFTNIQFCLNVVTVKGLLDFNQPSATGASFLSVPLRQMPALASSSTVLRHWCSPKELHRLQEQPYRWSGTPDHQQKGLTLSRRCHGSQPGTLPPVRQQCHPSTRATQQHTARHKHTTDRNSPNHYGPRPSTLPTPRQQQHQRTQTSPTLQAQPNPTAPQSTEHPSPQPTLPTTRPNLPLPPKILKETLLHPRRPTARLQHHRLLPSGLCGFRSPQEPSGLALPLV
jgi:hypothetical protein